MQYNQLLQSVIFLIGLLISGWAVVAKPYSVIDYDYDRLVSRSQREVEQLIQLNSDTLSLNQRVDRIGHYFEHLKPVPYLSQGAIGEGDWCDAHLSRRGCPHIQQDPLYRTDGFNCDTWVVFVMSLIESHSLSDFNRNIIAIHYGANRLSKVYPLDELSYRNRNHFVSQSFNRINQVNARLRDVTAWGIFSGQVRSTQADIDLQSWFGFQARPNQTQVYVRVLHDADGQAMVDRLSDRHFIEAFPKQRVSIQYIPKEFLVKKRVSVSGGPRYEPNEKRIYQIPTPSVMEIVRDSRRWMIGKKNIRDWIGSGINVSHMGLLYRHFFSKGQVIYQKIACDYNREGIKQCQVTPVLCKKARGCHKVMLLEATNAYPDDYVWSYDSKNRRYYCTAAQTRPQHAVILTTCNRVLSMPLGDYLTYQAYGHYGLMEQSAIVGINIQKIIASL